MTDAEFVSVFRELNRQKDRVGPEPLRWQIRLFRNHFITNSLPTAIDIPTGLGKTMVMAIWLIARTVNPSLPRRLVYVVDRRTVVDQATELAERLHSEFRKKGACNIHAAGTDG